MWHEMPGANTIGDNRRWSWETIQHTLCDEGQSTLTTSSKTGTSKTTKVMSSPVWPTTVCNTCQWRPRHVWQWRRMRLPTRTDPWGAPKELQRRPYHSPSWLRCEVEVQGKDLREEKNTEWERDIYIWEINVYQRVLRAIRVQAATSDDGRKTSRTRARWRRCTHFSNFLQNLGAGQYL